MNQQNTISLNVVDFAKNFQPSPATISPIHEVPHLRCTVHTISLYAQQEARRQQARPIHSNIHSRILKGQPQL